MDSKYIKTRQNKNQLKNNDKKTNKTKATTKTSTSIFARKRVPKCSKALIFFRFSFLAVFNKNEKKGNYQGSVYLVRALIRLKGHA